MSDLVHATTIAIGGAGVLLLGPSGAGKSDLALRLIDRGAELVSDDYTRLEARGGVLIAHTAENIAGAIEVRGIGIVTMPHRDACPVALAITLDTTIERMPEPRAEDFLGIAIPALALDPAEPSAPIKVEIALRERGRA